MSSLTLPISRRLWTSRHYDAICAGSCKAVKLSQVEWNRRVAYNAARVAKGDDMYNKALSASSPGKHKLEGMCEEEEEEEEAGEA